MATYVFIESRDPFESGEGRFVTDTASALRRQGEEVTVFLVQNGVLGARANARGSGVSQLAEAGVAVLADGFSLRERGIAKRELATGVREGTIDALVDLIARENTRASWH